MNPNRFQKHQKEVKQFMNSDLTIKIRGAKQCNPVFYCLIDKQNSSLVPLVMSLSLGLLLDWLKVNPKLLETHRIKAAYLNPQKIMYLKEKT